MQIKLLFQTNICEKLSEIGGRLHYPHVTKDLAKEIETLWEDAETYARGNELQVPDCTKYFMENLQRLSDVNYVPTKVLKIYHSIAVCKNRNSNPKFIPVGENKRSGEVYRLFDVGGKRNERRKWIHLFEGVTPVIYCAAISEYDQTLFEDDSKNRMMKPRNFLNGYLSSHVLRFHKTSFMLFLNKFDIFEKKILKARVFNTYVYTSSLILIRTGFLHKKHSTQDRFSKKIKILFSIFDFQLGKSQIML
ncbi:putative guanine nucleotide binding protein (G-protein), alpha subunit [Medicago truncatula]|uniref:Guanine nucleotide-binding protein alpha subunit n=1 Tax=Medicago truncatula TaxID=3880 RepID=A0A396IYD6_MEDTR|nr:putative guanine nucleotide binding protein (G-protein), alpha subunit [Medicago truncatula]